MWVLFEFGVIIACFALGCRNRSVAVPFLIAIILYLIALKVVRGINPVGLLVSFGGWLILDTGLIIAIVVSELAAGLRNRPTVGHVNERRARPDVRVVLRRARPKALVA